VCFAPKDDPQIAIAVYVEKGGHGSAMAIVARDILDQYFSVGDIGYVPIYEKQLS
jgi:penicillin-binding protein 2